jgi:hypothetical protein
MQNTDTQWVGTAIQKNDLRDIDWSDLPNGDNLRKSLSKFLLLNYIYTPFVLNEFLMANGADDNFAFVKKTIGSVSWDTIKNPPFCKGVFKKWDEENFNNEHIKLLSDLYEYFCMHIEWIYKLLFKYPIGTEKGLEMKNLFKDPTMLENRYLMTFELRQGRKSLRQIMEEIRRNNYNVLNNSLEVQLDGSSLYSNIFDKTGQLREQDVKTAIEKMISLVYEKVSGYVQ